MLSEKVEKALNDQIEKEAYSSQLYLSMASWAETNGFKGVSAFLYHHADEEREHMMRFIRFVNDRSGHAKIPLLQEPPAVFEGVKELFGQIYDHEKFITQSINEIVGVCMDEKDYTTQQFLQWFVQEQIEEESLASEILDKLNLFGKNGPNMYMFDKDIAAMVPSSGAE